MITRLLCILSLTLVGLNVISGQSITPSTPTRVSREPKLSSAAWEGSIALTPTGRTMYFASRRGGEKYNQSDDSDIYYSVRLDSSSPWNDPALMPRFINDELDQDEVQISLDGQLLTYQRWTHDWKRNGGPYYETRWKGNREWEGVQPLGGGITEFFETTGNTATAGMARLPDGSIIFAAGPSLSEPMDIYYSRFEKEFMPVQPLACNTQYDERSVFVSADGQTMYFASNRPGGQGGLDIYRTTFREDGTLDSVVNVGAPINSPLNDFGLVIYTLSEGYFIRDDDIYRVQNPDYRLAPIRVVDSEPTTEKKKDTKPCTDMPATVGAPSPPARWPEVPLPVPELRPPVAIPKQVAPKQRLEGQYIPNNAVFLLDVSSSMGQSNKLPLMRTAIRRALPRFFRRDKISIITFANNPRVLLNGIAGDQGKSIQLTLTGLEIGGTTEGKPALTEALRSAETHYIEGGQNLVIWATDAKLKLRELKPLARQLKKKKIDLVMLVYGRPDKEIDSDISRYTEEADGRYRWIQAENIDQVLEEILKLDRRKQ